MNIFVGGRGLLMVNVRLRKLQEELRWLVPEAPLGTILAAERTLLRLLD